jgi:hypothetical protein
MARYHATVESRCSATETFRCLSSFSNAAEWDPGVLAGGAAGSRPGRHWQPIPARRDAEVRVAQRVHEVGGRLAADERRAEGGRVVYVIVDGLLAAL